MKKRNKILFLLMALCCMFALFFTSCEKDKRVSSENYPLSVGFVNVGQGDGILIQCEDTVIAIDGGEESSTYLFNTYIKNHGVDHIDLYIATHPHSDHIGAIPGILSMYKAKTFMLPSFNELNMPATKLYEKLLTSIDENGCEVLSPTPGETYTFGSLTLDFYAPLEETENYNNMSLVFKLTYGNTAFLFTGDAEKESENLILKSGAEINADVLKVGHHGSSSSCSAAFINAVSPDIAVISCGKDNDYGHPHKETINELENYGAEIYRTDADGTIILYSDGNNIIKSVA